ncbi:sensor histidine kinase [Geobacter sulfurreducens]|uniref:sensor histidine kinase n=1 Tax=Geobacter sulfurreducens TaxID=35554 RepID=UPI0001E34313|nr:ATP-binding protein [Geobacter sulfurreducens]ADI83876.2 sensor histidine kinase, CHASE domain-containing [Geobacter sulfurreducens KN400]
MIQDDHCKGGTRSASRGYLLGQAIVVAVMVFGVCATIVTLMEQRYHQEQRHIVAEVAAGSAHSLDRQLSRSLSPTYVLASILRAYGSIRNFDRLAVDMMEQYGGISALDLAPQGVVSAVYPLAGNEKAIGFNLLNDPTQRTEALHAISSRSLTLAGPLELKQGGTALVGRLPVFLETEAGPERFWGFVIAVLRLEDFLPATNLGSLTQSGYDYEIFRAHPETGKRQSIARSTAIPLPKPVTHVIEVPNGQWILAVAPQGGWRCSPLYFAGYGLAVAVSLLVGALFFSTQRQPALLRRLVAERTKELERTNRELTSKVTELEQARAEIRTLNDQLELRVAERTAQLESANRELSSFSYSVSHDLRAPLRHIASYAQILLDEQGDKLNGEGVGILGRIHAAGVRMGELIDALLNLSRMSRDALRRRPVDLAALAGEILDELKNAEPERRVSVILPGRLECFADPDLIRSALRNLLENAWKYTARNPDAAIEFGVTQDEDTPVYYVKDNGTGFDMRYAGKLFEPFQRLHGEGEFGGTGVGLATVDRIIRRHGGRIWAEAELEKGATFYFTLGGEEDKPSG